MAETTRGGAGQVRVMSADNNMYTHMSLLMNIVNDLIHIIV